MKDALITCLLLAVLLLNGGCDRVKSVFGEDEPKEGEVADTGDGGASVAPAGDDDDHGGDASSDTGGAVGVGPVDPPYGPEVILPSGLRLDGLIPDAELTATYPDPSSGSFPFGGVRRRHYAAVGYFIDIPSLSRGMRQQAVSENFKLEEYVRLPEGRGRTRTYVDAQIAFHAQELRYAWGGPLIINSAFRDPEYNDAVGGALFSRHQYGDAVDIRADSETMGWDLYNLAKFLEVSFLEPAGDTIVGKNSPWIHIDDRGWPLNAPENR